MSDPGGAVRATDVPALLRARVADLEERVSTGYALTSTVTPVAASLQRVETRVAALERDHVDSTDQATLTTRNGRSVRPDLVVNLPGGEHVVVDAEAPPAAFLRAGEAPDDCERRREPPAHARAVRTHVEVDRELHERPGTLGGHTAPSGTPCTAVEDHNRFVGTLGRRVPVSARRSRDLDLADEDLPTPLPLEESVRPLTAPELLGVVPAEGVPPLRPGSRAANGAHRP